MIEQHVVEHAAAWFPGGAPRPRVRLRQLGSRPRALLYAVLIDDVPTPKVLAKVRRSQPVPETGARTGGRPRLSGQPLSVSDLTALEYEGLCSIFTIFAAAGPGFGAVRPLAHLVSENTILMEYVDAGTLRQMLVARSRLSRQSWSSRREDDRQVWRRAGAWLRTFQESMPTQGRPGRQATREDVVDMFSAYGDFLTRRVGPGSLGDVAARGAELAGAVLPGRLPLAVGHGDYAPRNVFLRGDGRLTVFDPMPRWAVPRHEDLCRFLVGMRLLGLQLHSHGAAYGRLELDRRENEVIRGYYGAEPVPVAELRCYQLLIMLDKWSALVDTSSHAWRARLRTRSVRLATGYLRGEARRLLDLAGAGAQ